MWHSLTVAGDVRVVDHIASLLPDAHHPVPALRELHYAVTETSAGFVITEEGDALATVATAEAAADVVHVRAHRRAFELASLSGWTRVHAATVDLATSDGEGEGRRVRVLVVGPSGAGKTTLATRLLFDGADVQGDESVLVRRGQSLAVPRALHLKPGAARVLPELEAVLPRLAVVGEVTVLDPARVDRPVTLRIAPVGHVVVLAGLADTPDHVTCTPLDGGAVLEALLTDAFPLTETKARMVSVLAGAMVSAHGHRLTSGRPEAMVEALRGAIG